MKTLLPALLLLVSLCAPSRAQAQLSFFCQQFHLFCPPASPGFVPTYITPTPVINNGFGGGTVANRFYFADQATATIVCQKLSCAYTFTQACEMGGGPATCSAQEIWLAWKDGLKENAGLMAEFFTNNPEGLYPNVAMNAIQTQLAKDRITQLGPSSRNGNPVFVDVPFSEGENPFSLPGEAYIQLLQADLLII